MYLLETKITINLFLKVILHRYFNYFIYMVSLYFWKEKNWTWKEEKFAHKLINNLYINPGKQKTKQTQKHILSFPLKTKKNRVEYPKEWQMVESK